MKQNKFVDGTHIFSKKMTHTLTLNVTLTKQSHLHLLLNLCSLSTTTSTSLFVATLCSMNSYVKLQHLY